MPHEIRNYRAEAIDHYRRRRRRFSPNERPFVCVLHTCSSSTPHTHASHIRSIGDCVSANKCVALCPGRWFLSTGLLSGRRYRQRAGNVPRLYNYPHFRSVWVLIWLCML